ncbi:MAG: hypothetical protein HRU38_09440 [Saccharospirillaceae bacterium]|nr:hypothetical protein [Pseudomonadales bacterium]NRB78877.1 hypothetical protein [Saccharospirillaceae bacterium]
MSRSKKSRSLKSKVSLKTGSKSKILDEEGNRGKIPSKNTLSKHKKKPISAYAKAMLQKGKKNETKVIKVVPHPFKEALKQRALEEAQEAQEELQTNNPQEQVVFKKVIITEKPAKKAPKKIKAKAEPIQKEEKVDAPKKEEIQDDSKDFKNLDGDELLDFFENF